MAFDLTCFITRQPNRIACSSVSVGFRRVTTLSSAGSAVLASLCCIRKELAPTLRTSHSEAVRGSLSTLINRRFFFFCSSSWASDWKAAAMMTSLKISAMASAHARSSG